MNYIVIHKNAPLYFSFISRLFLGRFFYTFCSNENRNERSTEQLWNLQLLTLAACCVFNSVSGIGGRRFPAVCSNWVCATFAKRRPMFIFSIFVTLFFDESLGKNI